MVEAMWRLYWEEFHKWLRNEEYEWRLDPLNRCLEELCTDFNPESIERNKIQDKLQVFMS